MSIAGVDGCKGGWIVAMARRVPALPFKKIPHDERGLRMEVWY